MKIYLINETYKYWYDSDITCSYSIATKTAKNKMFQPKSLKETVQK